MHDAPRTKPGNFISSPSSVSIVPMRPDSNVVPWVCAIPATMSANDPSVSKRRFTTTMGAPVSSFCFTA